MTVGTLHPLSAVSAHSDVIDVCGLAAGGAALQSVRCCQSAGVFVSRGRLFFFLISLNLLRF